MSRETRSQKTKNIFDHLLRVKLSALQSWKRIRSLASDAALTQSVHCRQFARGKTHRRLSKRNATTSCQLPVPTRERQRKFSVPNFSESDRLSLWTTASFFEACLAWSNPPSFSSYSGLTVSLQIRVLGVTVRQILRHREGRLEVSYESFPKGVYFFSFSNPKSTNEAKRRISGLKSKHPKMLRRLESSQSFPRNLGPVNLRKSVAFFNACCCLF